MPAARDASDAFLRVLSGHPEICDATLGSKNNSGASLATKTTYGRRKGATGWHQGHCNASGRKKPYAEGAARAGMHASNGKYS